MNLTNQFVTTRNVLLFQYKSTPPVMDCQLNQSFSSISITAPQTSYYALSRKMEHNPFFQYSLYRDGLYIRTVRIKIRMKKRTIFCKKAILSKMSKLTPQKNYQHITATVMNKKEGKLNSTYWDDRFNFTFLITGTVASQHLIKV